MIDTKKLGFSLIELLVAVIIVAILTAVSIPQYTKMVEKSKMRDAEAKLALIFQAQRIYRLDYGGYATQAQLIPGYMPQPSTNIFTFAIAAAGGPPPTTFSATATRIAPGGKYTNSTVAVTETFDGSTYTYAGQYNANGNPN